MNQQVVSSDALAEVAGSVFRKEGEYWTIAYGGTVCRLRDTRGLQYLAQLLRQPGKKIAVQALVGTPPTVAATQRTPTTASQAAVCRSRLRDLREELERARLARDNMRAQLLAREIDLVQRLRRSAAARERVGPEVERARLTVTKGLKSALEKIRAAHPVLAGHLMVTLRRGYFCSYTPDPQRPMFWEE
ncbi:MAG TPA: hypothetical protein VMW56_07485 [Candidatus Margulisiibacteriota bacterium]|nr:hypothetical protein [Candidatus Margulisiibacteriota bacterium]